MDERDKKIEELVASVRRECVEGSLTIPDFTARETLVKHLGQAMEWQREQDAQIADGWAAHYPKIAESMVGREASRHSARMIAAAIRKGANRMTDKKAVPDEAQKYRECAEEICNALPYKNHSVDVGIVESILRSHFPDTREPDELSEYEKGRK